MKTSSFAAQAVGPRAACAAKPPAKTPAGGSVCVAGKKRNAGSVDREPVSENEGKPAALDLIVRQRCSQASAAHWAIRPAAFPSCTQKS